MGNERINPEGERSRHPRTEQLTRRPRCQFRGVEHDHHLDLNERIYRRIRQLIITGFLKSGARLASSRNLALTLKASRNSVVTATERLVADGFLQAKRRSGLYVSYSGPIAPTANEAKVDLNPGFLPFALDASPVDLFPKPLWAQLQSRRWRSMPDRWLDGNAGKDIGILRQAIASHLATQRGLLCSPERIFVSTSSMALLDLTIRCLGARGRPIWVEDPGSDFCWDVLRANDMDLVPVCLDLSGFAIAKARQVSPDTAIALVTPSLQFPSGITMSLERRQELADWARASNGWILEDDFDWQHSPADLAPIAALCPSRVIYFDSFNHAMFPALGVAFAVLPDELIDRFRSLGPLLDRTGCAPHQIVLTDFIEGGHFERHLDRLRSAALERRDALDAVLNRISGTLVQPKPGNGWPFTLTCVGVSQPQLICAARQVGLALSDPSAFSFSVSRSDEVMLGYRGFSPAILHSAGAGLQSILPELPRRSKGTELQP